MRAFRRFFWGRKAPTEPADTATTNPDETPNAFTLNDVSGVALNAVLTSNFITVSGLGSGVYVSASVSGAASSNFRVSRSSILGPWQTSAALVTNGDLIQVQHIASPLGLTSVTTTLTVGYASEDFKSTTTVSAEPGGRTGQPIGLLLTLTYAS